MSNFNKSLIYSILPPPPTKLPLFNLYTSIGLLFNDGTDIDVQLRDPITPVTYTIENNILIVELASLVDKKEYNISTNKVGDASIYYRFDMAGLSHVIDYIISPFVNMEYVDRTGMYINLLDDADIRNHIKNAGDTVDFLTQVVSLERNTDYSLTCPLSMGIQLDTVSGNIFEDIAGRDLSLYVNRIGSNRPGHSGGQN